MARLPNDGSVSLATIAAAANVSISTVSRIVNGQTDRASSETVKRVRDAIAELGYRPNQIGRALKHGRTRIVAMLTANLNNPVMAMIAKSTESALREAGYVMILCDTHDRADLQDAYFDAMRSQGVEGYVLVSAINSPGLKKLVREENAITFVLRPNPYGKSAFVGVDNIKAGASGADCLLSKGAGTIAAISPQEGSVVTSERVQGFCLRLEERQFAAERLKRISAPGASHLEVGYEAARALSLGTAWPEGIMCASDQIAYGVYRFAEAAGIRIPQDCAIVSIDGSELNSWLAPWLVSIHVPYELFGTNIVKQLQCLWEDKPFEELLLPHHL